MDIKVYLYMTRFLLQKQRLAPIHL